MSTCQVELVLKSALGTPLSADTLWGHICWGLRYQSGPQALEDWLARYDSGTPPLVLSDPLPAGMWPRPVLPPVSRDQVPRADEAALRKKRDKVTRLTDQAFRQCLAGISSPSVDQAAELTRNALEREKRAGRQHEASVQVTHAGINRLTGGTLQEGGGALFTTEQTYHPDDATFTVQVWSPEPPETVRAWFEQGLAGGYGRDASSGLGRLEVSRVTTLPLPAAPRANAILLLAPVVPAPHDPAEGYFQFGVRTGRVGGDFAIGPLPDGSNSRQKRPVRCLLPGTVLFTEAPPPYVGRVIQGVHTWNALRHYGMSPVVPLHVVR